MTIKYNIIFTSPTVHFTSPKDWWTGLWMSHWQYILDKKGPLVSVYLKLYSENKYYGPQCQTADD